MSSRHAKPDRCPNCHAAHFIVERGHVKPAFRCINGCSTWTSGYDGSPYLEHAQNYTGEGPEGWVNYRWIGDELIKT